MADKDDNKLNTEPSEDKDKEIQENNSLSSDKEPSSNDKEKISSEPSKEETDSKEKITLDDLFDEKDLKSESVKTTDKPAKKVKAVKVEAPIEENEPVDYSEFLSSSKDKIWNGLELLLKNRKAVIALVTFILIVVGLLFLLLSPKFRVKTIEISGNHVLTSEDIIEMIGVNVGDHIYKGVNGNILDIILLDYGKTEDKIISKYPYVEDIKIHADFPSNISVEVKERAKIAVIKINDGFATIDSEGTVVELNLSNDGIDNYNPVICGLEVSNVVLGERIQIKNSNDYQKAIIILGAVLAADVNSSFNDGYSFYEGLQEIRIIPSGMIYLTFTLPSGSMLQVKIQSIENINDDMNWLVNNVRENSFENLPDGALDMTGEEYIYRAY